MSQKHLTRSMRLKSLELPQHAAMCPIPFDRIAFYAQECGESAMNSKALESVLDHS